MVKLQFKAEDIKQIFELLNKEINKNPKGFIQITLESCDNKEQEEPHGLIWSSNLTDN